jgi:hypothetical protein
MLNWNDKVELSQTERQRFRTLATSDLDRVLAQLSRTRAVLEAMSPTDPERETLLKHVRQTHDRVFALRQERLARVTELLSEAGRVIYVPLSWLEQNLHGQSRKIVHCGGELLKFLNSRAQAARRVRCVAAGVARPLQRSHTRSIASRSRVVAPVGAPPSIS